MACLNCLIYTYAAGTTTPQATYTDFTLGTPLPNPVRTNSGGYAVSGSGAITGIWIDNTLCYKITMKGEGGITVFTQDHICAPVTSGSAASFTDINASGNVTIGGNIDVVNNETVQGVTTTPVTGFVISPIFNADVAGLSGSDKTFTNSDGSYSVDYTGRIVGHTLGLAPSGNTTVLNSSMLGTIGHAGAFSQTTSAGTATVVIGNSGSDAALETGKIKFDGANTTGITATTFGSNCPAVTCTSPYTWITSLAADGSTVYIPVFK